MIILRGENEKLKVSFPRQHYTLTVVKSINQLKIENVITASSHRGHSRLFRHNLIINWCKIISVLSFKSK